MNIHRVDLHDVLHVCCGYTVECVSSLCLTKLTDTVDPHLFGPDGNKPRLDM